MSRKRKRNKNKNRHQAPSHGTQVSKQPPPATGELSSDSAPDLYETTGGSPPTVPAKRETEPLSPEIPPRPSRGRSLLSFPVPELPPLRAPTARVEAEQAFTVEPLHTGLQPFPHHQPGWGLLPMLELPPFVTTADVVARAKADSYAWIWDGYLAPGLVTVLAGKGKYAGKSTLLFGLLKALETNAPDFLGQALTPTPVVYLSEEPDSLLVEKINRFGLDTDRVRFWTRREMYPKRPFDVVVRNAVREAKSVGAKLLIVDTLTAWSGLQDDQENNPGAVQSIVMDPLMAATNEGVAVLMTHHTRKGTNPRTFDEMRGSTAIVGSVDIPCLLFDPGRNTRERILLSEKTRSERTPERLHLVLPLTGGYQLLDQSQQSAATPTRLQSAQPGAPQGPRVVLPSEWTETARALWDAIPLVDESVEPALRSAQAQRESAITTTHSTFSDWVLGKRAKGVKLSMGWVDMGWVVQVGNPARYYRLYQDPPTERVAPELVRAA
jgi:hypothetical protein